MKILYTGAQAYQQPQMVASNSLGGYMSNSVIPNNKPANLFDNESYLMISSNIVQYRGVVLLNELTVPAINVMLGILPKNAASTRNFDLEFAIAELIEPDEQAMERLPNSESEPLYAEFQHLFMTNSDDEQNMVELGDMAAGKRLGIWFKISYKESTSLEPYCPPGQPVDEGLQKEDFNIDSSNEGMVYQNDVLKNVEIYSILVDNVPVQTFGYFDTTGTIDLSSINGIWAGSILTVLIKAIGSTPVPPVPCPPSNAECEFYKSMQGVKNIIDGFDIIVKTDD